MSLGLLDNSLPTSDISEAVIQGFVTIYVFYRDEVVSLMPQPQRGEPGYLFWSDLSPLTCPAWEDLLVTHVTAGMALRFI
jgi:hypothetical protein